MRSSRILLLLACAPSSCATYHAAPIDPQASRAEFERHRLDSDEVIAFARSTLPADRAFPPARWTADDLLIVAIYYHPELHVARARVDESRAGRQTAAARPNPTLDFAPEFVSNAVSGVSPWVLGAKLDWPIETGDKRHARERIADAKLEVSRGDLSTTAWSVRSRVHAAWLAVISNDRAAEAAAAELGARRELVGTLRARFAAGDIARPDIASAEIELQRLEREVEARRGAVREARVELARAAGVPAESLTDVVLDPAGFDVLPRPPATMPARDLGLFHRADLGRALAAYAVAEAELEVEIAKQRPDFHLGPGFNWDQGDHKFGLGLSVPLPIFDRNEGPIAEALARRRTSAAEFEALQAGIIGTIESALVRYSEALAQLQSAHEVVRNTSDEVERASRSLTAGETDRAFTLEAKARHAAALRDEVEARSAARSRLVELEDALHSPLAPATSPVDFSPSSDTP
jgi:outer membrane protein TolC